MILERIAKIEDEMIELLEKRGEVERERMRWMRKIRKKYGLHEERIYTVSNLLGVIEEEDRDGFD